MKIKFNCDMAQTSKFLEDAKIGFWENFGKFSKDKTATQVRGKTNAPLYEPSEF
jgi:hypothetical protein